jgi:multidrug efflux system membrane fusion protein
VTKGLEPGDRVIVDGIQHVRPDITVAPTEAAPDQTASAAPTR